MGLSCFRAISGIGLGMDWGWDGNLCVGLFYEHRFAVLIIVRRSAPDLIFVTDITDYICGEKSVMWRNFRFL